MTHEVSKQFNEPGCIQAFGVDLEPEFAAGIDGRNRAHALALAAGGYLRCVPAQPPRAPQHLIRAHAGLVQEENLRATAFGSGAKPRKRLLRPLFDRRRVPLVGSAQWFLRSNVELGQQPSDRGHPQLDAEPLLDQRCHNLPRPQSEVESVLARILAVDPTPHLQLLRRCQLVLRPRVLARAQGFLAAASLRPQPTVNRGAAQSVALHHAARILAGFDPTHRPAPNHLRRVVRQRSTIDLQRLHATEYGSEKLSCVV